jgi:nucleotidyltransferase/DNA polymerase involved in DNA repair
MNQRVKRQLRKFSEDGLPRDANDWTVDDWRDLWRAYRQAVRRIAKRHREKLNAARRV